jgi:hypothetical protein
MDPLATWEKVLLGLLAVVLVVWLWPGLKASLERSPKTEGSDWKAVALPLAAVVLFVLLLIALV